MARNMDFYRILKVSPTASYEEIRSAYRKLARQFHPDLNPGNPHAEDTFKLINVAYEVLKDANRRQKYDFLRKYGVEPSNVFRKNPEEIRMIELEELLEIFRKEWVEWVNAQINYILRTLRHLNPLRTLRKLFFSEK